MLPGDGIFDLYELLWCDLLTHLLLALGVSGSICTISFILSPCPTKFDVFATSRPTGGAAAALLFFFLNLNPHQGKTFQQHVKEFDFIGLGLIVSGVVCILIGFNASETSCEYRCCHVDSLSPHGSFWTGSSKETIALLTVGWVLLVVGGVNEFFTKRSPIVPPRLFQVSRKSRLLPIVLIHS